MPDLGRKCLVSVFIRQKTLIKGKKEEKPPFRGLHDMVSQVSEIKGGLLTSCLTGTVNK